jgi:transcriptional regulator GlxA family with amidase domain
LPKAFRAIGAVQDADRLWRTGDAQEIPIDATGSSYNRLGALLEEAHIKMVQPGLGSTGSECKAGVHPSHLSREFRNFFKVTPGDYLRDLRVETAARYLSETDIALRLR